MADKPKSFQIQPEGEITKRVNADGSLSISSKQPVNLHIESIKSIGVENLIDVEVHNINRVFNSVSHYIKFHGGGEVRFAYDAKGELLEFTGSQIDAEVRNGERILLKRRADAPDRGPK
jgi:hypothetical protein